MLLQMISEKKLFKYCDILFKNYKTCTMFPLSFSINVIAFYHEWHSLIGYATICPVIAEQCALVNKK